MRNIVLDLPASRSLKVLCVGAHCDDIEIGCGATIVSLQKGRQPLVVDWIVLSGSDERRKETEAAMRLLVRPENRGELLCGAFPDGRFPAAYAPIKEFFESLKDRSPPDAIFCHERDDRHQDHRIVNEMVWNTFRDNLVLEYEIPKWDGGLGQPNVYVPLEAADVDAKIDALLSAHQTQRHRDWFTRDVFMAMLRMRGIECRAPSGYAEAFHGRKLSLDFHGAG
jgi:LmbE family N-acetylglucosaminyl deacetylase